ncbi:hypothetical protein Psed_5800 [Pseudonocardia dioxanivorans CB1190]|uniref:Uncharacterized protein n=1 Tax=Pseudonocardia dioxanivorans (strain ATCC 55486 / DSM 44775 / JCM 13855 / CB1190) TaxID=675635 RepID=F4D1D9_PSEUX|nr:hypothetical protein [Pseudonocardia dioxanivorans]AEA27927.1 hypothetical protein Psed_5800 [Pseudonocardia dioxanivorans CB1190]
MASMTFDISARSDAERTFLADAAAAETLKKRLDALDRTKVEPKADLNITAATTKITQLKGRLDALRNVRARVDVDGAAEARREVTGLVVEMRKLDNRTIKIRLDAGDTKQQVTTIRDRLKTIRDVDVRLRIDSTGEQAANRLTTKIMTLRQLSPIRLEVRVDDDGKALTRLGELKAAAIELGRTRPNIQVTADIAAAMAQVTALAARLRGLSATARVDLDTGGLLGQLARVQTELNTLAGGKLSITADTRRAMEELALLRARLVELGTMDVSPEVEAETAQAKARIVELELMLSRIAGKQYTANVKVDVDKTLADRIAGITKGLIAIGAAGGVAAAGLGTAVPAVATLVGSLAQLVGLAPLAVGGLAALGATVATVKAGLIGMDEAFSALDDPATFAAALKDMAPAGREFATSVRDIKTAFDGVRLDVQQKLFAGWGAEVKSLGQTYMPLLKSGMGGVATELNAVGKEVLSFAKLPSTVADVDSIFKSTKQSLVEARPAAVNMAAALTDIGVVGTTMLPQLSGGLTSATGRFREFIAQARQSGELKGWIQGGVDTLKQLGSIAGNVGSVLGSIFTAAKASGSDFLSTLDRVTEKVAAFFRSTEGQSTLIAFFTEARAAIDALLPGLGTLGTSAAAALKAFSETGGLQAAGEAISSLADRIAPLIERVGSLAGGALSNLASAAQIAGAGLQPLISVVGAVTDGLGPLAPAILAAVVAFKALGPAAAAMATLGTRLGALATSMGASAAAAGRVTTAVTAFGRALPVIGVAVVALGALIDANAGKTDQLAQAVIAGSKSMAQAVQEERASTEDWLTTKPGLMSDAEWAAFKEEQAVRKVGDAYNEQYAALSPMQKLQADVAIAQNKLNDAVVQYGAGTPKATAAAAELAAAQGRLDAATKAAADSTKSLAQRQQELVASAQSSLSAMLDLEAAIQKAADAEKAANEAARQHGAGSAEAAQANRDFVASADQAAQAAQRDAEARANAAGASDAAAQGTNAYGATLLQLAANAEGPARTALLGYIGKLSDAQLAALSAGAEASGFATQLLTLPDGRTVKIAVDPETGKIITTQQLLDNMHDKTVVINGNSVPAEQALTGVLAAIQAGKGSVSIDGQTVPVYTALQQVLTALGTATGTVTINGQSVPAQDVLTAYLAAVNSGSGTVTINGQSVPADQVLTALIGRADTSTGTVKFDGDPSLANGKIEQTVKFADGSTGTITFDGNNVPANGEVTATVKFADGSVGTIQIKARDAGATATAAIIRSSISSIPAVINVVTRMATGQGATPAGGGVMGYAGGGVVKPLRASRGYVLPGYAPGRDTIPAILSAGEAVLVPELVRMLGARRILAANAEASSGRKPAIVGNIAALMDGSIGRMGPRSFIGGSMRFAGRAGVTRDELAAAVPSAIGSVVGPLGGNSATALAGAIGSLRAELRALASAGITRADVRELVEAVRSARPAIHLGDSRDPAENARAIELAARFSSRG